jgi:hypothetical protein
VVPKIPVIVFPALSSVVPLSSVWQETTFLSTHSPWGSDTYKIEQGGYNLLPWWGYARHPSRLVLIVPPVNLFARYVQRLDTTNARHPLSNDPKAIGNIIGVNGVHCIMARVPSVRQWETHTTVRVSVEGAYKDFIAFFMWPYTAATVNTFVTLHLIRHEASMKVKVRTQAKVNVRTIDEADAQDDEIETDNNTWAAVT